MNTRVGENRKTTHKKCILQELPNSSKTEDMREIW